ncbi:porin, partial [Paraburkholderia kururiensis]|uniref:porin n=1 Tax=Paraburkholderia kururiensis TaxID=984307 RepID=UPI001FC7D40A
MNRSSQGPSRGPEDCSGNRNDLLCELRAGDARDCPYTRGSSGSAGPAFRHQAFLEGVLHMKKNLIAVAVAASFIPVAHAQSSVTLYGLVDAGITYTSNVNHGTKWALGSGGINQSMFGLRGAEDLGGGLKAIFTLESGFNINNGRFANNNGMFNRQAFVGL